MTGRVIAALAVFAALLGMPEAAHAQDTRPCVSPSEFHGAKFFQTRAQLEARWEVVGLGRRAVAPGFGVVTVYPRCGPAHSRTNFGVIYRNQDGRQLVSVYLSWRDVNPDTPSVVPPVLNPPTGQPVATTCDPIPNPLTPCT